MNTENNKIIAEFMGAYIAKKGQEAYDLDSKFPNGSDRLLSENMLYHSDWNWLMDVIFKITKLGVSYDEKGNELFLKIGENLLMLKIQPTYDAVVNLIKWHNQQKS